MAKTILTVGQRRLLTVVLVIAAFLLGNAAYLWLSPPRGSILPTFYQWMLLLHVVVGILILAPMAIFIVWHMKRALAMNNPKAIGTGIVLTVAMIGLAITGLFIMEQANSADNRWAFLSHQALALIVPIGYAGHRLLSRHQPSARSKWMGIGAPVAVLAVSLGIHYVTLPDQPEQPQVDVPRPEDGEDPWYENFEWHGPGGADPASVFAPASTTTTSGEFLDGRLLTDAESLDEEVYERDLEEFGFVVNDQLGAETCVRCHADIVDQWSRSVHRFSSFNNPFYRVAIEDLRAEDDGRRRSQWCAGCHDPAVMMAGNWMDEVDPTVPESQAGLTCLACHAIDKVHGVGGNGNYNVADAAPDPYLFADAKAGVFASINDLLVKSKPDVHKRDLLKPILRTSEFCATCHKVSLDEPVNRYRWLRGQDEYDAWHDSGVARNAARTFYLPGSVRRCQDCHMPRVDAPLGDVSAKDGKVRSHLFPGPNTALPHLVGDEDTVQAKMSFATTALRVDVFALKREDGSVADGLWLRDAAVQAGEDVELQVVVRNVGVGHAFPGGTIDSNEVWVHLRVEDAESGEVVFESGAIDPDSHRVDETAHFYRVVFVDEHGREADRRNPADFRAPVHVKTIGPGTADLVRYAFVVPDGLDGKQLRATAQVRFRKFRRNYTEYTWERLFPDRDVPVLPITDVAAGEAVLAVSSAESGELRDDAKDFWIRWNDWGIGLLLQGDTVGAERAFARVAELAPDRVDGPRNLARVALRDNNVQRAFELLNEAERIAPGDAQNAYFLGLVLERDGQEKEAIERLERALEAFPDDRTIHMKLGEIRFRLGEYDEALRDVLRVLAIDPEHRGAHYHRFLIYSALGDTKAAEVAEIAYRKYEPDESAQEWTEEFRRANPNENREDQAVHIHRLERVR